MDWVHPGRIMSHPLHENLAKPPVPYWMKAALFLVTGVALAALGIYIGETDDAPGAAVVGLALMLGFVVLGLKTAWRRE